MCSLVDKDQIRAWTKKPRASDSTRLRFHTPPIPHASEVMSATEPAAYKLGQWLMVIGLTRRKDLNGMVALVIDTGDDERIGVNVLGNEYKMKKGNLSPEKPKLVTFKPEPSRLDLTECVCKYESGDVVVVHSGERIKPGGALKTRAIAWNDAHAVVYNFSAAYGASVIPSDAGYLGGINRDCRDLSKLSAGDVEKIMKAANIEDSCGLMAAGLDKDVPKPWLRALSEFMTGYKEAVDKEAKEPFYEMLCAMMRAKVGKAYDAVKSVQNVAHYFADGRIPKYYLGLMRLVMIQPPVLDLKKCQLRPSPIGGAGGLGVFLRAGCSAKPGELLTLYPFRVIGKHYSKEIEGDAELDHHIMAQFQYAPETWQRMAVNDQGRLCKMIKMYSVQVNPLPGCAMFASHYPTSMEKFDSSWIGHMVNSTKNGHPVANCTLVGNLVGGFWWGVAALREIVAGEELIVDYGPGWFATHPDLE